MAMAMTGKRRLVGLLHLLLAEHLDDRLEGEPLRDVLAAAEHLAARGETLMPSVLSRGRSSCAPPSFLSAHACALPSARRLSFLTDCPCALCQLPRVRCVCADKL